MQMLQQLLGEQGARYAAFVLTAIALLIAILVIWLLIRKALGSRLNFSDKPDRRGRPPRLGITESFNVDRDGRRLVIVRRDNLEHLVMIGGPNDVVIETNIVRGERLGMGRNEQRMAEADLNGPLIAPLSRTTIEPPPVQQPPLPSPVQAPAAAPKPVSRQPATPVPSMPVASPPPAVAAKPMPEVKIIEAVPPELKPLPVQAVTPRRAEPASPTPPSFLETPTTAVSEPTAKSVAEKARDIARTMVPEPVKPVASEPVPVRVEAPAPKEVAAKAKPSFAERIKSGFSFGSKTAKNAAPEAPVAAVKVTAPEVPREVMAEVKPAATVAPRIDSFRSEMEQLTKSAPKLPMQDIAAEITGAKDISKDTLKSTLKEPVSAVIKDSMKPVIPAEAIVPPPPPVAKPAPPQPVMAGSPSTGTQSTIAKPQSKNPFDSLEDEMAKLLGRTPEGKG